MKIPNIYIYFLFLIEIYQIAKGHESYPFYFYTLPTSPPLDLECVLTTDSTIKFEWNIPKYGIKEVDFDATNASTIPTDYYKFNHGLLKNPGTYHH